MITSGIAFTDKTIASEKLMFKYKLNAEKIKKKYKGACLDCMLLAIKSPLSTGFGLFFLQSSTFQLQVYSQALAFSQVPGGITFTDSQMIILNTN